MALRASSLGTISSAGTATGSTDSSSSVSVLKSSNVSNSKPATASSVSCFQMTGRAFSSAAVTSEADGASGASGIVGIEAAVEIVGTAGVAGVAGVAGIVGTVGTAETAETAVIVGIVVEGVPPTLPVSQSEGMLSWVSSVDLAAVLLLGDGKSAETAGADASGSMGSVLMVTAAVVTEDGIGTTGVSVTVSVLKEVGDGSR